MQLKDPLLRALQMCLTPPGPKRVQRTMSEELPLPRRTTVGEAATLLSPPQRSQPPQGHGVGPGPWYPAFCHPTEPLPASPSCIPACELVCEFKSLVSAAEESDRVGASMNNDGSLGEAKQNLQFNHNKSLSLGYEPVPCTQSFPSVQLHAADGCHNSTQMGLPLLYFCLINPTSQQRSCSTTLPKCSNVCRGAARSILGVFSAVPAIAAVTTSAST